MLTLAGVSAASKPDAPTIGTATKTGTTTATVVFTAPANDGGATIISYTATSSPAGGTGTLVQSGSGTISVTGLTPNTSYTFTVTATNAAGTSDPSAASNSITTDALALLFAWGQNSTYGQLGLGDKINRSSPVQVGSNSNWLRVGAGGNFGAAVNKSNQAFFWGGNQFGQLGLGSTTYFSSPVQSGSANFVKGGNYMSQKLNGNTLYLTGRNQFGQLGLGDKTYRSSFVSVGNDWATINSSRTDGASVAVKTNGTLWTWGAGGGGASGILGLGNTTSYSSPKQVGALTNWAKPACNDSHMLCIKTDGTLWAWGANAYGQLGLGNTTGRNSPVQVGSNTNWLYVSTGQNASFATTTDGKLFAWGNNSTGKLGLGDNIYRSSPVQVGSLTNWLKTSNHIGCIALKTDGTLWTWGAGYFGKLGHGNQTDYNSPKQVGALTTWTDVSAGLQFCLAIRG